jgi:hypothetical protein
MPNRTKRDVTYHIDRQIRKAGNKAEIEAFAACWPEICEALGRFPPTRGEIEMIKLNGPPTGFSLLIEGRAIGPRWEFRKMGRSAFKKFSL